MCDFDRRYKAETRGALEADGLLSGSREDGLEVPFRQGKVRAPVGRGGEEWSRNGAGVWGWGESPGGGKGGWEQRG